MIGGTHRLIGALLFLPLVILLGGEVGAADQPVAGKRLVLLRAAGENLTLILKDPSLTVPQPGSFDDPTQNAGMDVLLFGHPSPGTGEIAGWTVPPGVGLPGWTVKTGAATVYRFRNPDAPSGPVPIRSITLRDGKLKIVGRAVGLALSAPQGSVGVLAQMGDTRICALFDGAAVRRDVIDLFSARGAPAPGLFECSEEGLFGITCGASSSCGGACPEGSACGGFPGSCTCISASQPCGETAPLCSGQCPAGEACANIGGVPYPSCGCLPEGSTGCGEVYPMCGDGDCPPGLGCFADTFTCCNGVTISGCACLSGPPPPPCGGPCPPGSMCAGPAPGFPQACYPQECSSSSCPAGSTCEPLGGGLYCAPIACSGGSGYPTCDGTCDPGLSCQGFVQGSGSCFCAP